MNMKVTMELVGSIKEGGKLMTMQYWCMSGYNHVEDLKDLVGDIWERGKEPCGEVAKFCESQRSQKSMDIGGCHGAFTPFTDHMECMLCPPFILGHMLLGLLSFAIKDRAMLKAKNNRSLRMLLHNLIIQGG